MTTNKKAKTHLWKFKVEPDKAKPGKPAQTDRQHRAREQRDRLKIAGQQVMPAMAFSTSLWWL